MVSIGNVWDRTTEFLGDNLRSIVPIAVLAMLIPSAVSASLTAIGEGGSPMFRAGVGVIGIVLSLLSLWGQLAITSLAIDGVGARRATERFGPAVGVFLLLLLVAFAVTMVVAFAVLAMAGVDFSQIRWTQSGAQPMQMPAGMNWSTGLLLLLFAIAFLAVAVRLATLTAVIVAERRGVGAIARAFRLTRGLGLKLVGVVLLYAIVSLVAQWAATAVFGSVLELLVGGEGPLSLAKVVTLAIAAAVQTVFTVLAAAFTAKLYVACVEREARIGAPATAPLS